MMVRLWPCKQRFSFIACTWFIIFWLAGRARWLNHCRTTLEEVVDIVDDCCELHNNAKEKFIFEDIFNTYVW